MERRCVGFRRTPQPFISLYDVVVIDDELCDRTTGQAIRCAEFVPVYEGDFGWEQVEAETEAARRQMDRT